ncbi:hypothetical protein HYV30_02290 [Candidatus Kaiserbacteria bacterium]|nr:hypothetical protein [Candidatus Kaiserbacteria bacterium]
MEKALPKKFIRTFAGDMEMLQKGGTPELAPLESPLQSTRESPKEKPLVPPVPLPPLAKIPSAVPKPEPLVAPLETYASDFTDKVQKEGASPATVLAAEQDSAPRVVRLASTSSGRGNRLYVIAGIILILAGGTGAAVAFLRYQSTLVPVILAPSVRAPIFVDEREEISGTGAKLTQAIEQSLTRGLAPGTIRFLYLAPATTTEDVFSQLNVSAPGVLLRNIQPLGSMAGVINAGGEQSPFFILSVTSYGSTLSGMLGWETVMPSALALLYPPYRAAGASATASSTAATSTVPVPAVAAGFRDEDIVNHDVRIYRDSERRSIILYGYWNQSTLIIARNPEAFAEILERLATSREE